MVGVCAGRSGGITFGIIKLPVEQHRRAANRMQGRTHYTPTAKRNCFDDVKRRIAKALSGMRYYIHFKRQSNSVVEQQFCKLSVPGSIPGFGTIRMVLNH